MPGLQLEAAGSADGPLPAMSVERLGLSAALLLACLAASRAQNAGEFLAPGGNAPAAANASAGFCSEAAPWRSTPLAQPCANEDFLPEKKVHWTTTAFKPAWPALIGLGAAAALLLLFLLWRCLRCCCGACCACFACCGSRRKDRPHKYLTARWLTCLKVLAVLLLAGLAGSCALGMVKVDAGLVGAGFEVLDGAQAHLASVIAAGWSAVAAADSVGELLVDIEGVLATDVNVTDLQTNLACIAPWLDSLPDPTALASQIQSARTGADTILAPALASLGTALGTLSAALAPAPSAGAYTAAMQTIEDGQGLLLDAQDGLLPQAQAFSVAAAALDTGTEDPAGLATARTALSALLTSPQALSSKLTDLQALQAAVQRLQAAATTDSQVPDALAALTAVQGEATAVAAISAALVALQGNFTLAQPCIQTLLDRAEHVNASVLLLPDELAEPVALLESAEASLSALMASPTGSPAALADYLDSVLPTSQIDSALAMLQVAAGARTTLTNLGLQAVADGLQSAHDDLAASQAQLASVLAQMDAYVGTYGSGGGMPLVGWAALVTAVQAAGSGAGSAAAGVPATGTLFLQAGALPALLPALYSAVHGQLDTVTSLAGQLSSLPDVAPYLASLADLSAAYDGLPSPPSRMAVDARTAVDSVVGSLQQTLDDGQATIQQQTAAARSSLADAEAQTVEKLESLKGKARPLAAKYDRIRQAVLYALFSAALLFGLLLLLSQLLNWPAGIKLLTVLTLLLGGVLFVCVAGLSLALKAGTDGCANLEAQVLVRLPSLISSPADAAKALAIARYYLQDDSGTTLEEVLRQAFGLDTADIVARVNATRNDLLQEVTGQFTLQPLLSAPVDRAVDLSYQIEERVGAMMDLASHDSVQPVYLSAKSFACCCALDMAGWQWLALVLAGSAACLLCALAFSFISSLDSLGRVKGCCACHRKRHFADEAPAFITSSSGAGPPTKAGPQQQSGAGTPRAGGGGKSKSRLNIFADARGGGVSPRSAASGGGASQPGSPQFIASWHSRRGSGAPMAPAAASAGAAGSGISGTTSLRDQYHGSPAGTPRASGAAAAASAAASRSELLGSRGSAGSGVQEGAGSGRASSQGSARSSAAAAPGNAAAAASAQQAAVRSELLSPARSATGSSKGGGKAGGGGRFKLFKG